MKTLLLCVLLILPPSLLVAGFAGSLWYTKDHANSQQTHRHLSDARYFAVLNTYEVVGGILGGLPGLLIVLTPKIREVREWRQARASQPRPEQTSS